MRSQTWASDLGSHIKERRSQFGLTQAQLAETVGCSRITIIEIESGKPTVRLATLIDVLQTLGLQLRVEDGNGGIVG